MLRKTISKREKMFARVPLANKNKLKKMECIRYLALFVSKYLYSENDNVKIANGEVL